jgi:hypothetical protein
LALRRAREGVRADRGARGGRGARVAGRRRRERAVPADSSPGPISDIYLGNELSCQVKLTQDSVFSYYPPSVAPGDCGTFLQREPNPTVFAPNFGAHDGSAASNSAWVPWTPVSQSGVGGSGTPSDPYTVTTTVAAGTTGLQVSETYQYVAGSRAYSFRITVINTTATLRNVDLYHAADCYLAGSDFGYGFFDASNGGVFCTESANNNPAGRVLGFAPGSTPARYIESFFNTVWQRTDGTDYPNTVEPDTFQDNGVGLQWKLTVPANGSTTVEGVSGKVDSGDTLETVITKGPKKKTKKKKSKFEFAALLGGVPITNATFTCTVNTKPPVSCTSPFKAKGKKGKKNTFAVQATANGEADSSPAAQQWKVKKKKKRK